MTREKPQGVGIDAIPVRSMLAFGVRHGHVVPDPLDAEYADLAAVLPPVVVGGLLPDWAIRQFVTIEGFVDYDDCPDGVVSYGLTSAGYDIRVGGRFKVFTNANVETVSPKNIPDDAFVGRDLTGHNWHTRAEDRPRGVKVCTQCGAESWMERGRVRCRPDVPPRDVVIHPDGVKTSIKIPPNSFALAETVEVLHIPRNVSVLCLGKSTYARCGIIMNFTPFEPGWFGVVTVEITNSTPLPVEIFAYQGIGQAQYSLTFGNPEKAYGEKKNAKYQGQTGLTLPTVK